MSQRYHAVDALRGLIMMLMAIDHASAFFARQHGSEFWSGAMTSYTSAFPFVTRLVTHLCAPGFFFLMGAGIVWGSSSPGRIALRGLVILLAGQVLEGPILYLQTLLKPAALQLSTTNAPPPMDGSPLQFGLITLSGLGLAMMACALLVRLPAWTWLATSAACIFATNTLLPADGKAGPLWLTVLLAPGLSHGWLVVYPVLPWLAGTAAGMYFARWWRARPAYAEKRIWLLGLALVLVAVALRAWGGWGNIRPPRDAGWIEFLNNVKYPPSLVFWTLFLGIDLLALAALLRAPESWKSERSPLMVFGQTPLFFYLVHFYVLAGLALVFFPEATSLERTYVLWVLLLAGLYPVCRWYRHFKMGKQRESLWRLF